jgi:hypothetical protein
MAKHICNEELENQLRVQQLFCVEVFIDELDIERTFHEIPAVEPQFPSQDLLFRPRTLEITEPGTKS